MKFIDFHTHVYPDAIAAKAADSVRAFYDGYGNSAIYGTTKMLLERGTMAGMSQFVILPVAMRPDRVRHINDFILEQVAAEPKFIGFGTIHAAMENIIGEVDYIREQGLRGIKMHPDSQVFDIDDPRLLPVYEHVQGKLPVILHMGDKRFDYSHPARLRRVLDMFPKLQVIAAHFGAYQIHEQAYEQLKDKDCFFDVSSSLMFMEEGMAENYVNQYGAERLAFGTDYPMFCAETELNYLLQMDFTDAEYEKIFNENARQLFHL